MDLGAFLRPGDVFSAYLAPAEKPPNRADGPKPTPVKGRLFERRGRPLWVSPVQIPVGSELVVTVELPGYDLADDGALNPAGPETRATVILLGRVRGCRLFPARRQYVLRLLLLGRIWSD